MSGSWQPLLSPCNCFAGTFGHGGHPFQHNKRTTSVVKQMNSHIHTPIMLQAQLENHIIQPCREISFKGCFSGDESSWSFSVKYTTVMALCMLSLDPLKSSLVEHGGSSLESEKLSQLRRSPFRGSLPAGTSCQATGAGVQMGCGGVGRGKY